MTTVAQHLVDAVTLGSIYALLALGVALIFGIMRLINFAYGELIMVAGFAVTLVSHLPWYAIVVVPLAVSVAFALAMERVAFRPVRSGNEATLLVTSFAVSYLLQNVALLVFGANGRTTNIWQSLQHSETVGGVVIPRLSIVTIVVTAVLLTLLHVFLNRTEAGLHMRAAAEDFRTARMLGVQANRVIATAFGISGLLAGVAALFLVGQSGSVTPTMGVSPLLVAFVATVLGGMGRLLGAVVGGFVLAIITVLLTAYLPGSLPNYTNAFVYAAVILLLLYRPAGLLPALGAKARV